MWWFHRIYFPLQVKKKKKIAAAPIRSFMFVMYVLDFSQHCCATSTSQLLCFRIPCMKSHLKRTCIPNGKKKKDLILSKSPVKVKAAFSGPSDQGTPAILGHFCSARIGFQLYTPCGQGIPAKHGQGRGKSRNFWSVTWRECRQV